MGAKRGEVERQIIEALSLFPEGLTTKELESSTDLSMRQIITCTSRCFRNGTVIKSKHRNGKFVLAKNKSLDSNEKTILKIHRQIKSPRLSWIDF